MNSLLLACQLMPLLGFIAIFLTPKDTKKFSEFSYWSAGEKRISTVSSLFGAALGISIAALLTVWALAGFPRYEYEAFTLYSKDDYRFPVLFYLDKVGAAYLFCIWIIFSIIIRYCQYYLHREAGYKRFFLTIFAFVFGLIMVILSGSIDMLFAGWEIVGVSSFLLIAFYRHRPQPVRNALRAYTVYRFCDIGLLLGAWMTHMLFHESDHFGQIASLFESAAMPPAGYPALLLLSLLIVMAASGKSAQFPFCFWLPRAMEGPTPSSAIFYGALSVHLGVFLLLRTMPIWSYHFLSRAVVFLIGLLTVCIASLSEKTQSNIKGQIAYASITQVGFMFMELALGLETLVLVHFLGNAFLRCYQLLVSPSIVAHLLRVEGSADTQFSIKTDSLRDRLPVSVRDSLPEVLRNTLYVFSLQECNLEWLMRSLLWDPLKKIGAAVNAVSPWIKGATALVIFGLFIFVANAELMHHKYLAVPALVSMVLATLGGFSQKHSPFRTWNDIALSYFFACIAVWFIVNSAWDDAVVFLTGIIPAWLLGIAALHLLLKAENFKETPFAYRAMAETKPRLSLLLFISFLGLVGFPITPAFIGEDLLLYHASSQHPWFAALIAFSFVVNGIAAARIFLRLCMGRGGLWN
ncbi:MULTISPECIES: proton-conducting transporter membrane subunit [Methylomicrobium]|uniref:NADH:ubiquinone oxidoreductase subunit 5 (Chain L)/multisubunit Na+/H+ antiporter, MnhA subunit n=1 Tax=Methylomicrobium album BG8 TaxID=686340 RepID=H8GPU6_METAL|nr:MULTISPECIES: proton-conducting transporter membrane subunit [Methylomicrobium]EIC29725.1 NADH:ubiquinone oxidoreductase subunit 5 (chain L)/multisubunit Na+/H+ antiporter, MnhA subunit [Methylomicrobium album BG8]